MDEKDARIEQGHAALDRLEAAVQDEIQRFPAQEDDTMPIRGLRSTLRSLESMIQAERTALGE